MSFQFAITKHGGTDSRLEFAPEPYSQGGHSWEFRCADTFASRVKHESVFAGTNRSPGSDRLGDHLHRAARTLFGAETAALAIFVIYPEAPAWAKLYYCVVGTHSVAVVAFKAVATGKTPPGFE